MPSESRGRVSVESDSGDDATDDPDPILLVEEGARPTTFIVAAIGAATFFLLPLFGATDPPDIP